MLSKRPVLSKGAVAAGHPLTAQAAADILDAGGNAFDAIIAATFSACVTEPVLSSLGGGGFGMLALPGQAPQLLDCFSQTPGSVLNSQDADFYPATVNFGPTTQTFHIGAGAVAVPGLVRGLFKLHQRYASMPMPVLAEAAIHQARHGVEINDYQAYIYSLISPIYLATPASRQLFESKLCPGEIVKSGEVVLNPDLADFLSALAEEGDALFYEGEVAARMVDVCQEGGALSAEDLRRYTAVTREPIHFSYDGWQVFTNPPPSAGGSLITFGMQLLESVEGQAEFGSVAYLNQLKHAMRLTSEARLASMADCGSLRFDELGSTQRLREFQQHMKHAVRAYRGTTHISVIDAEGGVAAFTTSNGEGCGDIVAGTGMMLNNMLGEEDLNPAGFFKWQPNVRMSSMMAPTLALHPGGDLIATGSGGSNRIRTAILQVLANLLHFKQPLHAAVQAPRIHYEKGTTYIEGGFDHLQIEAFINSCGEHRIWDDYNMFFGGVHTVQRVGQSFDGVGDPRRGGVAVVL